MDRCRHSNFTCTTVRNQIAIQLRRSCRKGYFRRRLWREGPHPRETAGRRPASDTEPSYPVDPIGGCALDRGRVQTVCSPTIDPREEPGALAALAGICAGGEERSSFLPWPFLKFVEINRGARVLLQASGARVWCSHAEHSIKCVPDRSFVTPGKVFEGFY